jgi:acetyl esterase/lipase
MGTHRSRIFSVLAAVFLVTFGIVSFSNELRGQRCYPSQAECIARVHRNQLYGHSPREVLDLYVPQRLEGYPPLVVYIHGGGFTGGDKDRVPVTLVKALLAKGYAVASVNSRPVQQVRYPEPMLDVNRALRCLHEHAQEFHLDGNRIVLSGSSAGGGIALWIGLRDHRTLNQASQSLVVPPAIAGVIAIDTQTTYDPEEISKVFDTRQFPPFLGRLYGMTTADLPRAKANMRQVFRDASPVTHLTADDPPVVLIYTTPDVLPGANAPPKAYLHHVKFGEYLKLKADKAGAKVMLRRAAGVRKQSERFSQIFLEELKQILDSPSAGKQG